MQEKRIHVLYYTPGKNMRGLNMAMQSLRKLYGNNIIALPKDIEKLEYEKYSIYDLIGMRNMLNHAIAEKRRELGIPDGQPIPPPPRPNPINNKTTNSQNNNQSSNKPTPPPRRGGFLIDDIKVPFIKKDPPEA